MPLVKVQFEKIMDQHAVLRSMVQGLKDYLEDPRPALGDGDCETWAQCLAEKLTKLHGTVLAHFREEERSGFLDDLEEKHPRASHAIDSLRADHDRILSEFRAILSAVMIYAEGRAPENPQIRSWANNILDQLSRHEAEETDLFQRLQYRDLGTGD